MLEDSTHKNCVVNLVSYSSILCRMLCAQHGSKLFAQEILSIKIFKKFSDHFPI